MADVTGGVESDLQGRIYRIMRIVLPVIGVIIGAAKITGIETEVRVFESFGVSDNFRIIFGALQIVGAIFLFILPLEVAGIIVSMSLFAIISGLMIYHHMFLFLAAPIIGMVVLTIFSFVRRKVVSE